MLKSKNLPFVNRKITFLSSPLSLLVLSACGGGGSVQTGPGETTATTVTGSAVKGPLSNAWVFLDYNDNGVWDDGVDSARVRTDSQGAFALTATNDTYTIVATTDQMTTDTSSGAVFSGVKMSAPSSAQVVTPATTLMKEAGITKEQVAEVLGLPDGVDPLSFNPYADGVNASDALAVEKASQQIMSVVNAFAGAAEGAGASEADAFEAALNSVVEVVKVKATNLTDANASAADKTLDLTSDADLARVKAEVVSKVAAETRADTTAFNALADNTTSAVKNVNAKIANVTDISSDAAKNTFSTTQVLADQTKQAAEAEVQNAGSGSIDFTDKDKVDAAVANKAPTDITLSKSAIAEDASSLEIGTLSTTDSDQTPGVAHTYKIAELAGTDYAAFSINATTGVLSFKSQPDFETKSNYSITILSTDEGGKTFSKSFTISVSDVNEAPTLTVPTGGSVTEDASTSTITGSLSSSDPEDDAPTYSVVGETASDGSYTVTGTYGTLTLNASTGAYSYALNDSASAVQALKSSDSKTESFSVQVTDGTNTPAAQTLSFTIQGANDAPTVANAIADQTIAEDSTLNFQFASDVFSDVDAGDSLTYTATLSNGSALPSWLSFNAATRTFSGTPTNSDVGALDVTVTATDGGQATATDTFTLTVTNTNDAPTVANAIADQTIAEDSTLNFQFASDVFSDVDAGDSLTYTATLSNGSALPSWLSFNAATRTFSGTPTNSDVGALDVTVTATDGGQATATDTFTLTVTNTNDAPTVANAIADQTIAEDSTLNFQFASDVFSDVDAGDSLTYTATLSNGSALPSWLSFNAATRTFSGTPTNSDVGALDVTVTATDGGQATATDTFTLSVMPITSISISTTDFIAEEGSSTGAFTLTRAGSLTNSLTVDLQFSGTAQNGSDYDTISQTAVFSAGQESLTLTVNPKKDTNTEGAETVNAEILSSSDYAIENPSASLEIRDTGYIAAGKVVPLAETFQLNSLPGADITFYLNFLGGNASANTTVQPFTIDGDPTTYTAEEHTTIQRLWADVAEDFAPFNVNVTTQKPSDAALKRLTADDSQYGIEMIIGDTNGNAFAVAGYQISGIGENSYLPGFVKWGSGYGPTANAISHEFGHMLGLDHDGSNIDGNYLEYYGGHQTGSGTWMPIMGVSGWGMGQWSNGDYVGATETEDDLAIITRAENGIEYRIDDHADVKDFATKLVVLNDGRGTLFAEGIIEKNTDEDWFEFVHSGGNLTISIDTIDKDPHTAFSPNLDISAELYNASGSLIQENGLNSRWLDATISQQNLAAGTYYLKVDGVGNPDAQSPSGQGYSDYGSMGAYTVKSGYGTVALFNTDQSSSSSRLDLANFNSTTEFSNDVSTTISQNGLGVFVGESNEYMRVQALNGVEDTNEYLSFTITPGSGKAVDLSDLTASFYINFDATLIITSDQDNFSSKLSTSVLPELQRLVIDLDGLPTITSETELRMQIVSDTPDDDPFRFFDIYGEGKPSSLGPSIGLELNGYVLDAAQGQVATGYEDEFVPDIA